MNHADCHNLLKSLSEYIDGELSQDLCTVIDQHLAGCDNCRIVIDSLRKTISLYQATNDSETDLPTQVRERLYQRLNLGEYLK
jgi:anti-sigma factor (TIGR02949 family)